MENSPHNISKALLDLASVSETVLKTTAKGRAVLKSDQLEHGHRALLDRIDGFRSIEQLLAMSGDIIAVHKALGKLIASGCVATDSGAVMDSADAREPARPAAQVAKSPVPVAAMQKPAAQIPRPPAPASVRPPAAPAAPAASVPPQRAGTPPAARPAPSQIPATPGIVAKAGAPKPLPPKPVAVASSAPAAASRAPATAARAPAAPASAQAANPVAAKPVAAPVRQQPQAQRQPTELDNAKRLLLREAKLVLGNGAAKLEPRIEACGSIEDIYDLIVKFQDHLATTGKADPKVFLDRLTRGLAEARQKTSGAKLQAAE